MSILSTLWKWAYVRFIADPQVVADLYVEECDDINNALQCSGCFYVIPPEYAICPNCQSEGTIELVWYPEIEEDGGDIAFDLEPEIRLTPEQARAIEEGAKFCSDHQIIFDEPMCPECHHKETLAENPDIAAGEEIVRQAIMRSIA